MNWAILLTSLLLLVIILPRGKPKILWVAKVLLAAIAGTFFALTGLGQWVAGLIGDLLGWIGSWIGGGAAASVIASGILVALAVLIVLDVVADRTVNMQTIVALLWAPVLVLIAAGPIADGVGSVTSAIERGGQSSVGQLIGG